MLPTFRLAACAALVLLAASARPARADEPVYTVRLDRIDTAGVRYQVTTTSTMMTVSTAHIAGEPEDKQEETSRLNLDAELAVIAVSPAGLARQASYTIRKFERTRNGATTEVLPRGDVVTGEDRAGKSLFSVPRKELTSDQIDALEQVWDVDGDEARSDDRIFGPREPRKVGDAWPVAAPGIVAMFQHIGLVCDPASVQGTTKFVETSKKEGRDYLHLVSVVKVGKCSQPQEPGASEATEGTCEATMDWIVPADGKPGLRTDRLKFTAHLRSYGKPGTEGEGNSAEVRIESESESTTTPLPAR